MFQLMSIWFCITVLMLAQALANKPGKLSMLTSRDHVSRLSEKTSTHALRDLILKRSTRTTKQLHKVMKRWGRMMFDCHCSGFHVGCHSDHYCAARHGSSFRCIRSCCGMTCSH